MQQQAELNLPNVANPELEKDDFNKSYDYVIDELQAMYIMIKKMILNGRKFQKYLSAIGESKQKLCDSIDLLIKSCRLLKVQCGKGEGCADSVCLIVRFLSDFIASKRLQELQGKIQLTEILEIDTKITCALKFVDNISGEKDITNSPKEDYAEVWSRITMDPLGDPETVKQKYKLMQKMLFITTSAAIQEASYEFCLLKKACFGLSYPKYLLREAEGRLKSYRFYRHPKIETAQNIWNIPDQGATKELAKVIYEGIKTNLKIYVPLELNQQNPDIFTENINSIQVRILYYKKLYRRGDAPEGVLPLQKGIVHMHGGGFIALSSRSMQNYTRKWANALKVPVFSVDYRMPSLHPFPTAPHDCLLVYEFLTKHLQKYFHIELTDLFIAGDSAGGNLSCALASLILKNNLLQPKGLYLIYPALDLRVKFSPSKLYAMTDPLLWPTMLILCLESYLTSTKQREDPLASPLLMTEGYISGDQADLRFPLNWPRTFMAVGKLDPLYDDTICFMKLLVEAKVDCKCRVYDNFSHGFMSTDAFMSVCTMAINNSIEELRELMQI